MKECTQIGESWEPRYNFVFLFARDGYYQSLFGEQFYRSEYTRVYRQAFSGSALAQKLFRLHWAYKLNRIFPLPLKSLWFKRICSQDFLRERPLCFVYLGGNSIRYDGGLTDYIRKHCSQARQVVLHLDLISKKCDYDYSIVRNKVDAAVTYDRSEAERYGIHWYPSRFYNRTLPLTEPDEFETDVYFLGNAKDRLDTILQVYHRLQGQCFRCKFLLTGVPEEKRSPLEGISYIDGISYGENLQNIQKTKCVLEIGQGGTSASTLRLSEAVTYHRLLLTNCCGVLNTEYYLPETMSVFSSAEDIDLEFLRKPMDYSDFSKKDFDFSTDRFLQYLERILEEEGNA